MTASGRLTAPGVESAGPIDASPDAAVRIERGQAILDAWIVPWDTATFGFPVAEIREIRADRAADLPAVLDAFRTWADAARVRLASCRLDHDRLRESIALEAAGFRFIELVYEPVLDPLPDVAVPDHPIVIAPATAADLEPIAAVAREAFTTGRFALDPRLDPTLNGRRYAGWVESSFAGSRQTVLKATLGGELAGFFIVEDLASPGDAEAPGDGGPAASGHGAYWHLTAIAPAWQGRGIGRSVWQAMLRRARSEGAAWVRTTISGHNVAVLNLYARLGFRFTSPRLTFHWLRDESASPPPPIARSAP